MRRRLSGGYELDDDPVRVDVDAVHAYLTGEAYWALGRPRDVVARLIGEATRVVALYRRGALVGFCRAVSDHVSFAYLADVYVLPEHRGRGLGRELVREMVEGAPFSHVRWLLHTGDAHGLYAGLGFATPGSRTMEREPPKPA